MMANIKQIGVPFDRTFRNDLNDNFKLLDGNTNQLIAGVDAAKKTSDSASRTAKAAEQNSTLALEKASQTQAQLDEIVLENGNSEPEIVQARGGETLLYQRLDKTDEKIEGNEKARSFEKLKSRAVPVPTFNGKEDFLVGSFTGEADATAWEFGDNYIKPKFSNLAGKGTHALYKRHLTQDGEVGVTIKNYKLGATTDNWVGLVIRGASISRSILVMVSSKDQKVSLANRDTDGVVRIVREALIDKPQSLLADGKSIDLVCKFFGNQFRVYVNGTLYIETSSTNFNSRDSLGYFGVFELINLTNTSQWVEDVVFENLWCKEYRYDVIPGNINKVLVAGDSNAVGQGVSESERWSSILDAEIKKAFPSSVVNNVAVGGKTIAQIRDAQVSTNLDASYDMCVVLGGTNNSRMDSVGTTVAQAVSDMRHTIRFIKALGVVPIVCLPSLVDRTLSGTTYSEDSWFWLSEFRNALIRLCMTEKVIYSDFYREMNNDTSLLQSDKIHLSTGGHAAVANEIIKTIYGKNKSL